MENRELRAQLQRISSLVERSGEASNHNIELMAHWARYLCILVAGFLENAIAEIYGEFAKSASSEHVASYVRSELERIRNPNADRFLLTARSFRTSWAEELDEFLEKNGGKDAIDSIMANRHLIAHGRNSGISMSRVKDYLKRILQVLDFIEAQCQGRTTR
jgi:RiboL-PSP-HEPN